MFPQVPGDSQYQRQDAPRELLRTTSVALAPFLARAVGFLEDACLSSEQQDEVLLIFALRASISRVNQGVLELNSQVPSLLEVFKSMRELSERSFLLSHVSRLEFAILLKAAYELILMALCQHYSIAAAKVATTLMDRLQLLKPNVQPPNRLNCFFELKELVNYAAHPKDAQCSISLNLLNDALHAFVKVISESATILKPAYVTVATPTTSRSNILPRVASVSSSNKVKTRLCSYWQAGGVCPYGHQCRFAHGEGELADTTKQR